MSLIFNPNRFGRSVRAQAVLGLVAAALASLCAALLGSLLLCTSAWAARGHVFSHTLGEPCSVQPCGPGQLRAPSAVAVSEASGDVYVLDEGNNRVQRFSTSGAYLGQFDGSGKFEVANDPEPQKEGAPAPTGAFAFPLSSEPQVSAIAVDNSCSLRELAEPECAAKDPSNGDAYVLDAGHEVVDKFNPQGEYLGQITEAEGEALSILQGVAVDREGSVWVLQKGSSINGVLEQYENDAENSFKAPFALPSRGGFLSPGLAVDGEGAFLELIESVEVGGVFQALKISPAGQIEIKHFGSGTESASGIAADQLSNSAFVDFRTSIAAFDHEGRELERLEVPGEHGAGLAADAHSETLYAADGVANLVDVYTPQEPGPPTIESEGIASVTAESATFQGEVNPRGSQTSYRFEYGQCATPDTCAESPYEKSVPVPDGEVGEDFEIHSLSEHVQDLSAGRSYHFRLSARNEAGGKVNEVHGPEKTFSTQGAASLVLPDGRAWELVSPPDKLGSLIAPISETGIVQAAGSGDAITYLANAPIEAQPQGYASGAQILSGRSAGGWHSENLTVPHAEATGESVGHGHEYRLFTEDLTESFVQPYGAFTPSISPEASEQTAFKRNDYLDGDPGTPCLPTSTSCFKPLVSGAAGFANVPGGTVFGQQGGPCPNPGIQCGPQVEDATPDGRHAIVASSVALTATAIEGQELYEWSAEAPPAEQLKLISVLPNGQPAPSSAHQSPVLGFEGQNTRGALSEDGRRVVWEVPSSGARALYLRDLAKSQTIQLDKAEGQCEAKSECQSGGGSFQLASADGSRVLFTDVRRLTADAGKEEGKADLYECRILEGPSGEDECELEDLTPETGGESADVLGTMMGSDKDAQWLYFVANGVLSSQPDSQGEKASPGGCTINTTPPGKTCNLYVRHEGQTRLVAVLGSGDRTDWGANLRALPARASENGHWLAFMSERSLTGYDNRDALTGQPDAEVYLYDAIGNRLVCASCEPSGARPLGIEYHKLEPGRGGLTGGPRDTWPATSFVAAIVPGWVGNANIGLDVRHQPRYLSDQGRLLFNSADGLVPQDVNSTMDVYEYEPPKVGSCENSSTTFSARSGGCVDLISSGESTQESAFLDASRSGGDVFFMTSAPLAKQQDRDSAYDVYDAHICSAQSPCPSSVAEEPPPCETGDSCKPAPTPRPEIFGAPASALFSGVGNPIPPPTTVAKKVTKKKAFTRAQKLANALRACRKKHVKSKRTACERAARKRYAPANGAAHRARSTKR